MCCLSQLLFCERKAEAMSKLDDDPIAIQEYSELMVSCQHEGCLEDFAESLSQPASDPVERWAEELSKKARLSGWA